MSTKHVKNVGMGVTKDVVLVGGVTNLQKTQLNCAAAETFNMPSSTVQ